MSKNKLFIVVSFVILICISFGFLALSDDNPTTTGFTLSPVKSIEQTPTSDLLGSWSVGLPVPTPGSNGGSGVGYSRNDTVWSYSANGDVNGSGLAPGDFRRYNVLTNTWTTLPNSTGRAWVSAGKIGPVSNTDIYLVGGLPSLASSWTQMTGTLQRYNINTNAWTTMATAPTSVGNSGVDGYQDSLLYAVGGMGTAGAPVTTVQLYNRTSNTWRVCTPLPVARASGWMVIKNDTIYYGCGVGPTTGTFNNNIYIGVISQTDRSVITWTLFPTIYPGANSRHKMNAALFGCYGIFIGPGMNSVWWGPGQNEAYTWGGGTSAFVSVGPVPVPVGNTHLGVGSFQRGNYKVWKAVLATGWGTQVAPYHILNNQIYTDSCYNPASVGWCEGFTPVTFPPSGWTLTGSAALWSRDAVSGFGNGVGSAKADFYSVSSGTQQLNTHTFPATMNVFDSLVFQNAYCTFVNENDQLQINTSTNGGTTWTLLVLLNGGVSGELVTAPPNTNPFTPTSSQWKYQRRALPVGTNKIQFNAITAYGNNLYIDSICVKTIPLGITPIGIVANEYSLSQNYPNPFNPTTTITYNLPSAGNVKLVVFDILGREVATLVNGNIKAGMHNVVFEATNLSSGVYFYKLVAGDVNITKKMLLIK